MEKGYTEAEVQHIAEECMEFEHIISAMGYGYSLLNVSPDRYVRRCPDCVHWLGGSCEIFRDELSNAK
ncbi:MAG: hypothetical protein H6Q75_235 [Firmicutes bacterium]|nr:hypothetical protein [Bacillota bacterium]